MDNHWLLSWRSPDGTKSGVSANVFTLSEMTTIDAVFKELGCSMEYGWVEVAAPIKAGGEADA